VLLGLCAILVVVLIASPGENSVDLRLLFPILAAPIGLFVIWVAAVIGWLGRVNDRAWRRIKEEDKAN
jgi:hypothetical protein